MGSPYQNPPIGSQPSTLEPGMAAPALSGLSARAGSTTGGFPNIPDSSGPGLVALQEPPSWFYDFDPGTGEARATFQGIVQFTSGGSETAGVTSFNTRTGTVTLETADVEGVGGVVNPNAALTGTPTAPTAAPGTSSTVLATTAFVQQAIAASAGVLSFNGRTGAITLSTSDIVSAGGAPSNSPALTGAPTSVTPVVTDNSSAIATTAFVNNWAANNTVLSFNGRRGAVTLQLTDITSVGGAPINAPQFTGSPTAVTQPSGTSNTTLATTAFVENAVTAASSGVVSFNGRSGVVTLTTADVVNAGGAPSVSPQLTGTPVAPTASAGTASDQIATTAFVDGAVTTGTAGLAPSASPTFTGTVTLPASTTLQTPLITGVTDGSSAPAGDIGEQLSANGTEVITATGNTTVGSLALSAGDWLVTVAVGFVVTGGAVTGNTFFALSPALPAPFNYTPGAAAAPATAIQSFWAYLPNGRTNITTATTYSVVINNGLSVLSGSPELQITWIATAVRIR